MILITGFEPFGGEALNPSRDAASLAADLLRTEGVAAAALELPCIFGQSISRLRRAVEQYRPELVLCTGQAGGRSGISLERVAINCDDARIPDNAGNQPVDQPVCPGGPAAYFSTLPIKQCLLDLAAAGLPAHISQTAGTYVCNHVFYGLMDALAGAEGVRGGFIHVPYAPEQAAVHGAPGMAVRDMAAALAVVVRTSMATTADARLPAGAEH